MRFILLTASIVLLAVTTTIPAHADTTSTLRPTGDGGSDSGSWSNTGSVGCNGTDCHTEVDESSGSSCTDSDGDVSYVQSSTQNSAQTFNLDLSTVSSDATISQIDISLCVTKGQTGQTNTYQTRYCLDGFCTDSGTNLNAGGSYQEKTQLFSGLNITKTNSTDLEIGVIITGSANKLVRISQISAVVTYAAVSPGNNSGGVNSGSNSNSSNSNSSSNSDGHGPLYSVDGSDKAAIKLDQGEQKKNDNGQEVRVVEAPPGQTIRLTSRPVDHDQLKTLRLRTAGHVYNFTDDDGDGIYNLPLHLSSIASTISYSLTADYGITTRTEYGSFVLGSLSPKKTLDAGLFPFINRLFRSVFHREPSYPDWQLWAGRVLAGEKQTLPELYGAMQWQNQFGVLPSQ